MPPQLDESIREMRSAVLIRLAQRIRLYVDVHAVDELVNTLDDEGVWSSILHSNAGVTGFFRRILIKFVHPGTRTNR